MKPEEFLKILAQAARLKITTRHCYTEEDRKESVADHSWRIALMAMLLTGVEGNPSQATSPLLKRPGMTRMWKTIFSTSG